MYSLEEDILKGWVTEFGGYTFFYSKPLIEKKFYHQIYKLTDSKTLVINDFSLLDGGIDAVTSTETLRAQVLTSSKMEGFLGEETTYKKID
jgi:hypothetical protein